VAIADGYFKGYLPSTGDQHFIGHRIRASALKLSRSPFGNLGEKEPSLVGVF
jgi:hypothetical protein